jgi:DNA-binding transcriptional regulator YhcF (GntR family)
MRLILAELAELAGQTPDGVAWPSVPTIARSTGLAESTVRAGLRRLEGLQLIATLPRWGASSRYQVATLDPYSTPPASGGGPEAGPYRRGNA